MRFGRQSPSGLLPVGGESACGPPGNAGIRPVRTPAAAPPPWRARCHRCRFKSRVSKQGGQAIENAFCSVFSWLPLHHRFEASSEPRSWFSRQIRRRHRRRKGLARPAQRRCTAVHPVADQAGRHAPDPDRKRTPHRSRSLVQATAGGGATGSAADLHGHHQIWL